MGKMPLNKRISLKNTAPCKITAISKRKSLSKSTVFMKKKVVNKSESLSRSTTV